MKKFIKIFLFISLLFNLINAKDLDLNESLKIAQKENKNLMFFFHMPLCPYCERMLEKNFKNKEVLNEIKKDFILFKISSASKDTIIFKNFKGSAKNFAKFMDAKTYPTTVFVNKNAKTIRVARGYRNIDEYLIEIKYITSKSYKKMDIQEFADELEMNEDD